jgi:ankyrin repeat protein
VVNLIDDNLLDLSYEPLVPGPWTQELQQEFTMESIQQPEDSDSILTTVKAFDPLMNEVAQPLAGEGPQSITDKFLNVTTSVETVLETDQENLNNNTSKRKDDGNDSDYEYLSDLESGYLSEECSEKNSKCDDEEQAVDKDLELQTVIHKEQLQDLQPSLSVTSTAGNPEASILITTSNSQSVLSTAEPFQNQKLNPPNITAKDTKPTVSADFPILKDMTLPFAMRDFDTQDFFLIPKKPDAENLARNSWFLHHAALTDNILKVKDIINKKDTNRLYSDKNSLPLNRACPWGHTPLDYAAMNGNIEIMKLLLHCGAMVECKDPYGFSTFHWSLVYGQQAAAEVLIKGNNLTDPCIATKGMENIFQGWTPLSIASHFGHVNLVQFLLRKRSVARQKYSPHLKLIPPLHATVASVPYLLMLRHSKYSPQYYFNVDADTWLARHPEVGSGTCIQGPGATDYSVRESKLWQDIRQHDKLKSMTKAHQQMSIILRNIHSARRSLGK